MMKLIIAAATITVLFSSPTWAVQDYDRPYMYCPSDSKHYGKVVLGDIRRCYGPVGQRKTGRK